MALICATLILLIVVSKLKSQHDKTVSLANELIKLELINKSMSCRYKTKRSGPKTLYCGTPILLDICYIIRYDI